MRDGRGEQRRRRNQTNNERSTRPRRVAAHSYKVGHDTYICAYEYDTLPYHLESKVKCYHGHGDHSHESTGRHSSEVQSLQYPLQRTSTRELCKRLQTGASCPPSWSCPARMRHVTSTLVPAGNIQHQTSHPSQGCQCSRSTNSSVSSI